MRKYEAACVFHAEDAKYNSGKEDVRKTLVDLGASDLKDLDMGVRTLAYPIKKQAQGHYLVYEFDMDAENAHKIEDAVRLQSDLLRILVIRKEN